MFTRRLLHLTVACAPQYAEDRETLSNLALIIATMTEAKSCAAILVVEQDAVAVEHWTRQSDNSWLVREIVGMEGEVPLESIGCRTRLAAIYEAVQLAAD